MARRKKIARRNSESLEIDITSLLDILVILLVFLLKSYNPSDLTLDVAEKLTLPDSNSKELGHKSVMIQVNSERRIWVDNKEVGSVSDGDGEIISDLFNELQKMANDKETEIKAAEKRAPASDLEQEALNKKKRYQRKVNIVLDKDLPYKIMRKVMHTAASSGFPEFKFIVKANHD